MITFLSDERGRSSSGALLTDRAVVTGGRTQARGYHPRAAQRDVGLSRAVARGEGLATPVDSSANPTVHPDVVAVGRARRPRISPSVAMRRKRCLPAIAPRSWLPGGSALGGGVFPRGPLLLGSCGWHPGPG